jgi:alpha-beta hydrolase superfamily lysophospholipase
MMISRFTFVLLATITFSACLSADTQTTTVVPVATEVSFTHNGRSVHGLLWGKGVYGVVLSHGAIYDAQSWTPLAGDIAKHGMVVLSLEEVRPDDITAAHFYLQEKQGVKRVALIGASAGGSTAITAMSQAPSKWDQLILLSSVGDVSALGSAPKLFVASEDEGISDAVRRMAKSAQGKENETLILEGSAHAQAIFRTQNGSRLTNAILKHLIKRAQQTK